VSNMKQEEDLRILGPSIDDLWQWDDTRSIKKELHEMTMIFVVVPIRLEKIKRIFGL